MYKTLMNAIWDSIRLFQNHLIALAGISLPFIILLELFEVYYLENTLSVPFLPADLAPLLIAHLTIKSFYGIAIVFYLASVISDHSISVQQAWTNSIRYWPAYLLLSVLSNLLIGTGLLFYFIPGIFILIRLSFAEFHLLLDKQSPLTALKSSFVNTRKSFLLLTAGYVLLVVITFYPFTLLNNVFGIGSPELNMELLQEMVQVSSKTGNMLMPDKLLIEFPDSSFLKSGLSIIFEVVKILFTIFTFRIYHLAKEQAVKS